MELMGTERVAVARRALLLGLATCLLVSVALRCARRGARAAAARRWGVGLDVGSACSLPLTSCPTLHGAQTCAQGTHPVGTARHAHRPGLAGRAAAGPHVRTSPCREPLPLHMGLVLDLVAGNGTGAQPLRLRVQPRARAQRSVPQEPVRVQIFTEQCAVIGDPELMKRVLQTNLKNYAKDLEFSYSPFIVRAR